MGQCIGTNKNGLRSMHTHRAPGVLAEIEMARIAMKQVV